MYDLLHYSACTEIGVKFKYGADIGRITIIIVNSISSKMEFLYNLFCKAAYPPITIIKFTIDSIKACHHFLIFVFHVML